MERKSQINNCARCEHSVPLAQNTYMLCEKRGIVGSDFSCRKFSPDPMKKAPQKEKQMESTKKNPPVESVIKAQNSAFKAKEFISPLAPRKGVGAFWRDAAANKKYLLLCFFIPAVLTYLMYVCFDVYPIGEGSVLVLDLNGQYVYFFDGFRDIVSGEGSLLYSFSRGLGGEFMGIFAYYLSSPFSIIVSLFPKEMITEALLLMFILKAGCCGLTFGIYIEATRKRNRAACVAFATMYALCGYAVVMQHNTMWIDNLILLPIIMLGIENLIKYGKFKMLVISLAMAIFSNFYIGFMTCIFVALYYFYYYFSRTPEERNPLGEKNHFLKSSARMTLYCLITLAICAALLLCTYHSLKLGKTTFSNANYRWDQKFDWMDMITKMFIGSYDTVRPEGLPFLYSGTLTLILLPLYFIAPHIKTREKIASGVLIAVFLASFNMTKLDLLWHGLQRPNWLNYRYSFILCFLMILFAYKAFERLHDIGYRKAIGVCGAICAFLIVIQKLDYKNVSNLSTIWLSIGFLAIYLCILRATTLKKELMRRAATLIMVLVISLEMFCGGLLNMDALGLDVVYSTRTSYRSFIDAIYPVSSNVLENDTSFYRMEKTVHRKTNDNFALGMNGLSNSTSTLNSETIALLNNFGLSSKSHWSKYLGGTPVLDTVFGVKYVITKPQNDEIMELYEKTDLGNSSYTVWKNPYAMSLAAGVSPDLLNVEVKEYKSAFELMNATVSAMTGDLNETPMFVPADVEENVYLENMYQSYIADHVKYAPQDGFTTGRVTYTIHITSDDVLYMFIPSDYPRECYLYVNGLKDGSVMGNETDRVIELGSFTPGEIITVTFENVSTEIYFLDGENYFCYLDSKAFSEFAPTLSESSFMIHDYNDDYFKGTINVSKGDELIYTSLPYDEGWRIYADGKEMKKIKLLGGLIGFELENGEHVLEMEYRPDSLYLGLIISSAGILAFAGAWVATELYRRRCLNEGRKVFETEDCPDIYSKVLPDEEFFEDDEELSATVEIISKDDSKDSISTIDENKSKYPLPPEENPETPENNGENSK